MTAIVCAWIRNDLRTHDSPVLHRAAALAKRQRLPTLPVYVIDPRHYRRTRFGNWKTGPFRALFVLQAVRALKRKLRSLGSDLLVRVGHPEEVLPPLLPAGSTLLTQQEVTSEELGTDRRLRDALGGSASWEYCWGSTLLHKDDLPFREDLSDAPDVFTVFKNKAEPELAAPVNEVPDAYGNGGKGTKTRLESRAKVRPCLPDVGEGDLPLPPAEQLSGALDFEPDWSSLPFPEPMPAPESVTGAALVFEGGEAAALQRLQYYLWDTDLISRYFDIRNGMLGGDYSTKLAPWLAAGCISPRKIFEQVREYEMQRVANKSTYWVLFELMWRDFFRFFAAKHGDHIFRRGGVAGRARQWGRDEELFERWATGHTGYPMIDANMRELRQTGFMSNRGRQIVASFLAHDLNLDWRLGADWFESYLVDYDVTANWGNWVHAAGLTTGRINRFNVVKQSKVYDAEGDYIRHWVPELSGVPAGVSCVHEPWLLQEEERRRFGAESYPPPCVPPERFHEAPRSHGGRRKGKRG